MKTINRISCISMLVVFCNCSNENSQSEFESVNVDKSKAVIQGNEIERRIIGAEENIYCNPILISGSPLDYGSFTIHSKGELTLVGGEPGSPQSIRLLFHIQLRRHGKLIDHCDMDFTNRELYKFEVSKVLAFSKPGDQLIIEPADKKDWKAKRVLKVIL